MQRKRKSAGFTLLEVLLVIAILGVIAAMVIPQLLGRQRKAMIDVTKASIQGLEQSLKMYAADHDGEYATGNQDIYTQLMEPVDEDGQAMQPYLEKAPRDAWGELIYYEYPNSKSSRSFKPAVWSSGPNKQNENGAGDDINNWTELEE